MSAASTFNMVSERDRKTSDWAWAAVLNDHLDKDLDSDKIFHHLTGGSTWKPTDCLTNGVAPKPTETAQEAPLIDTPLRVFPDDHPSYSSVKDQAVSKAGQGAPAIIYPTEWAPKTVFYETICDQTPTEPKRSEGKQYSGFDHTAKDVKVPPYKPDGFELRDSRVIAHAGHLAASGNW